MPVMKESVSMGKFPLNARVSDLDGFSGKLEKRFSDLGYKIEVSRKGGSLQLLLSKDGLFKTVPGLFPFIGVTLSEHSDQCEIELIFARANGLETSAIMQLLTNTVIIVDPCPVVRIPRYDYMIGSLSTNRRRREMWVSSTPTDTDGRSASSSTVACSCKFCPEHQEVSVMTLQKEIWIAVMGESFNPPPSLISG